MHLTIDADTAAVYRQGCDLVVDQLTKAKKKVDDLEALHLNTSQLDSMIKLAREAKRLLDDQGDLVAEERTRRGIVDEQHEGQLTIDEAVEGSEQEAARLAIEQIDNPAEAQD